MIISGRWNKDAPIVVGWYWFKADADWDPPIRSVRLNPDAPPVVVLVGKGRFENHDFLCCRFQQGRTAIADMKGRWCGPIQEPSDD